MPADWVCARATVACGGSAEEGEEGIDVLLSEIREIEDTL
jgi:hypothetical protein